MATQHADFPSKILVLDDNVAHTELLLENLQNHRDHFELKISNTVTDFFRLAGEEDFDLFLIDYNLPGATGLDVLHQLRNFGIQTPVVFLSGLEDEMLVSRCQAEGVVDFVLKTRTAFRQLPTVLKNNLRHLPMREKH